MAAARSPELREHACSKAPAGEHSLRADGVEVIQTVRRATSKMWLWIVTHTGFLSDAPNDAWMRETN